MKERMSNNKGYRENRDYKANKGHRDNNAYGAKSYGRSDSYGYKNAGYEKSDRYGRQGSVDKRGRYDKNDRNDKNERFDRSDRHQSYEKGAYRDNHHNRTTEKSRTGSADRYDHGDRYYKNEKYNKNYKNNISNKENEKYTRLEADFDRYDEESYAKRSAFRDEGFKDSIYETNGRSNQYNQPQHEDELPYIIMGRNAVREAVKSGRSIDRILVVAERDGSLREVVGLARDRNIVIQEVERKKLDELCMPFGHGGKPGNHQGIVARVPGAEYVEIDDILNIARERGEEPFIIILDGITDPYNLGSIIRSAECAGAHGIIIPKRRSVGLTASAVKVSAGAAEHIACARVVNISAAIERLKRENIWVAGADMEGGDMYSSRLDGALAIVIGAEGEGLSKLVKEKCDFLVSIPLRGKIESLNASVAAAIVMFEKNRQDALKVRS